RSDIADRVAEVGVVEYVVGISAEVDLMLVPDGEVLGNGVRVALEVRCPLCRRTSAAEGSIRRLTKCASRAEAVDTRAGRGARNSRGISSEPVTVGTANNLH